MKVTLTNRHGLRIVGDVAEANPTRGTAVIMPGLGGLRTHPLETTAATAFRTAGFTSFRFDPTHSFGESDGEYPSATTTSYVEDLEDVAAWARAQPWFGFPLVLAGNSLGGLAAGIVATRTAGVAALALFAPVVSGQLSLEWRKQTDPAGLARWQQTGWREEPSKSLPGVVKRLPWSHMEDRLRYDLLPLAPKLTMPVLLIVGEKDESCPPAHQELLRARLAGPVTYHVVPGAPHSPADPAHLAELEKVIREWTEATFRGALTPPTGALH